ncbi:MAG: class II fructose-bisphosphate aldolase [Deltaproteobacteria bacterium]|nr:class II fructose-bisphosphate aldolase [Deltaproteobacteria bacterium]
MELKKSVSEVFDSLKDVVRIGKEGLEALDAKRLGDAVDWLVYNAVFNADKEIKANCRWIIKSAAASSGARLASIQGLYEAMGRGEVSGFTVPAVNIRGLTYDVARGLFRSAIKNKAGAFIFEIAKSEMGYTDQSPHEYAAVVIAAALKEGYKGPLFIQGDHFQVNPKNYAQDKDKEISGLKDLINKAVSAGFYNIDIDSSTVVDLHKQNVVEQQMPNFELTSELTEYIRDIEPEMAPISIGGEIGEVGGKNSTEEELRVFMDNYLSTLARMGNNMKGISKMSIQTGTSHGGVVLPDGAIAKVKVDFDTIEKLSKVARKSYGLAGVVQHGASTLPDDAFDIFPRRGAAEVHLATGFQNMIFDGKYFPDNLKQEIYKYLRENMAKEKKEGETDEQFIYKTRKKAFGPFKQKIWDMPQAVLDGIRKEMEERFDLLFGKLKVNNTYDTAAKWANPVNAPVKLETEIAGVGAEGKKIKEEKGGRGE